jgi:putative transposase
MSIYRYIEHLDPEEVDTARFGKWMARQKHQQVEQGPRPERPNERWELDHTLLDVVVIDEEDGLPIGRPTLTAVRDKYSGCIPGFALSFEPPCAQSVLDCLLYAIPEKTQVQKHFGLKYGYVGYGVPETLVVDQGKEMLGRDLEEACLQLGIKLVHNPGRSPWMKGSIERWFGALNTDMVHALPGTTFSHVLERGDYRSEHVACVTLDGLWVLLHRWIVEVYTREYRRGSVQGVPVKLWERAMEKGFVPRLPANREALTVLLSRRAVRTVHRYGIELEGLLYQDARLAKLRSQGKRGGSVQVNVKYHAGDLSRIWVLDEQEERYIEVEAVNRTYTDGLSLWKHRVIRAYVREEMKKEVNQEALGEARVQLHREMREAFGSLKSLQSRKRAARWMNRHVSQLLGEGTAEEEMMQEREGKHEEERGHGKREPEKVTQDVEESTEPDEEEADMVRWYGDGRQ